MAISGKICKFETMYTRSLKSSLGLPLQTPNNSLLELLKTPSLTQIAAHHVCRNFQLIQERFATYPSSLTTLAESLLPESLKYSELRDTPLLQMTDQGNYNVDLLVLEETFDKNTLGLATGTFLTLRKNDKASPIDRGTILSCPKCLVPATQIHFLNECPSNVHPRHILQCSIPHWMAIPQLSEGDIHAFFRDIRSLPLWIKEEQLLPEDILPELLWNLAKATSSVASLIVSNTLSLYNENTYINVQDYSP
jgi:hypothetical protein